MPIPVVEDVDRGEVVVLVVSVELVVDLGEVVVTVVPVELVVSSAVEVVRIEHLSCNVRNLLNMEENEYEDSDTHYTIFE